MTDFENRHMIEALRSGVPSRSVGKFFSSSRKEIMDKATALISESANGVSNSMVIKGQKINDRYQIIRMIGSKFKTT